MGKLRADYFELNNHHPLSKYRRKNGCPDFFVDRFKKSFRYKSKMEIPVIVHASWHAVFDHLTPDEAIKYIDFLFGLKGGGYFNSELLKHIVEYRSLFSSADLDWFCYSWKILFDNLTPSQAKIFIKVIFFGVGLEERKDSWSYKELVDLRLAIKLMYARKYKNEGIASHQIITIIFRFSTIILAAA